MSVQLYGVFHFMKGAANMADTGGRIPQEIIDEIAARVNILDVISQYVPLKRRGANFIGLCPFHNEKTPSFTVSQSKQFYHCFGCGAGGNVFSFIMNIEHLSFPEAVRKLAKETGVHIPERTRSPEETEKARKRMRLFELNELAAAFYHSALKADPGAPYRVYLKKRQIEDSMIDKFGLGACVPGWDHLSTWLLKKGAKKEELITLGLSSERKNGTLYDRFRDRLIFPIRDEQNRVVGFGGRIIEKDIAPQKYLNSSETPLFHKGSMLFGLNLAKSSIRSEDQVLVVEGYMDVLSCHQYGIENVVAPLGTALTSAQIKKLMRYSYHFLTAFDGDRAGVNATLKGIEQIEALGGHIRVITFPDDKDPDEFLKDTGKEGFQKRIFTAEEGLTFYIRTIAENYDMSRIEDQMQVLDKVLPLLQWQKNPTAVDHALEVIARETGFSQQTVRDEWQQHIRRRSGFNYNDSNSDIEKKDVVAEGTPFLTERERRLFFLLLEQPSRIEKITRIGEKDLFTEQALELFEYIKNHYQEYGIIRAVDIPTEYAREISHVLNQSINIDVAQNDAYFDRLLLEQQYDMIVNRYNGTLRNLSELEQKGETEKIKVVLDKLEALLNIKTKLEWQLGRET